MYILIHEYITGGGLAGCPLPESLAREGRAMRRAMVEEFRQVEGAEIVETLDERFESESQADGSILVGSGRELDVLTRTASRCDFTLVIAPETGGVLEKRTRLVESVGRSLGSTSAAIALTADKLAFAGHLQERGIATPRTVLYDARRGLPEDFQAPYVMKPRDGAGAVETRYVEKGAPVGAFHDPMIVQEHCPGDAMSASFLIGADGFERLWGVGWQSVAINEWVSSVYQRGPVCQSPTRRSRRALCERRSARSRACAAGSAWTLFGTRAPGLASFWRSIRASRPRSWVGLHADDRVYWRGPG